MFRINRAYALVLAGILSTTDEEFYAFSKTMSLSHWMTAKLRPRV